MSRMKGQTFEKTVINAIVKVKENLYEAVVIRWANKFSIAKRTYLNPLLSHHKYSPYPTNVTFQETYRPTGCSSRSNPYFSNKHKM